MTKWEMRLSNFIKIQINDKYNDDRPEIYVFPRLNNSDGSHLSFHRSGISQIREGNGESYRFNSARLVQDTKRFIEEIQYQINLKKLNEPGTVSIIKTGNIISDTLNNFLHQYGNSREFIDYYNLNITNTSYPKNYYRNYFPYKKWNIDISQQNLNKSISSYETDNIQDLIESNLEVNKINRTNQLIISPKYGNPIWMAQYGKGININLMTSPQKLLNIFSRYTEINQLYEQLKNRKIE